MYYLGFPDSSAGKESTCNAGDPSLIPGLGRFTGEGIGYPLQYFWTFLVAQLIKESTCNMGDLGVIPGLGRSLGEGKGYPLQYSGLQNSMDGIVHGVAKSQTQLSHFHFHQLKFKFSEVRKHNFYLSFLSPLLCTKQSIKWLQQ